MLSIIFHLVDPDYGLQKAYLERKLASEFNTSMYIVDRNNKTRISFQKCSQTLDIEEQQKGA